MIIDSIVRQGSWFFRWRSYVLLGFFPLGLLAINKPEVIEASFGQTVDSLYESACIALAFLGLGLRAFTVAFVPTGTSGRNTRSQIADTLNTTGMYSLTRNPLYLGNAIIYMAIALFTQDVYFSMLMLLFLIIYLERIIATEERFLAEKFGGTYLAWASEVPAFFPKLSGWKASELTFSLRNILRREYSGLFAIIVVLFSMEAARDLLVEYKPGVDTAWLVTFIAGAAIYVGLLSLKKYTSLLKVKGR